MARVTATATIDAGPDAVWAALADIGSHVGWMADAEAIRFTSATTRGVGTTFECDTRVGPFRLTDEMEVTGWEPGRVMRVRHVGVVTGAGAFTLTVDRLGRTRVRWREELTFPWWMGGPLGGLVGGRVLGRIWRSNLRRLKARVEGSLR